MIVDFGWNVKDCVQLCQSKAVGTIRALMVDVHGFQWASVQYADKNGAMFTDWFEVTQIQRER